MNPALLRDASAGHPAAVRILRARLSALPNRELPGALAALWKAEARRATAAMAAWDVVDRLRAQGWALRSPSEIAATLGIELDVPER